MFRQPASSPSPSLRPPRPRSVASFKRFCGDAAAQVDIRTFHSFGLRVIRSWSEELGFGNTPPAVYGREDARAVLREAAREMGLAVPSTHTLKSATRGPSRWRNSTMLSSAIGSGMRARTRRPTLMTPKLTCWTAPSLADLAAAYERRLKSYAAVDYPGHADAPAALAGGRTRGRCRCSRMPIAGSSSTSTRIAVGCRHHCCSDSRRATKT